MCESDGQVVLYAVLFGYKGLLQALALLLAFRTRNVKVKGLDDSVYIAASIYVTSVVLAVIIVSTYTLMDYVNTYPAVVGMGLLLGTTAILGLVFIPRVRNSVYPYYYCLCIRSNLHYFLWLWSCLHSDAIIFVDVMYLLFLADDGAL